MTVSLNSRTAFLFRCCIVGYLLLAGSVAGQPVAAQQTDDQESAEQPAQGDADTSKPEAEAEDTAETKKPNGAEQVLQAVEAAKKKAQKRWYLGARPGMPALKGPPLGPPVSIIPQPFVPQSLDADNGSPVEDRRLDAGNSKDGDLRDADLAEPGSVNEDLADPRQNQLMPDVALLESADLALPDPSIMALTNALASGPSLVGPRDDMKDLLNGFATRREGRALSPVLDKFTRALAHRGIATQASVNPSEIADLARARLALLARLGDKDAYRALLNSLVTDVRLETLLAKTLAEASLLTNDFTRACDLTDRRVREDQDIFWTQLATFCAAARGDRSAADFQLSLLEESAAITPSFYIIIDQILLEAESELTGSPVPDRLPLSEDFDITPLHVAMARLAKSRIDAASFDGVAPLALMEAIQLPGLSEPVRITLVGDAVRRGLLSPDALADFFRSVAPGADSQALLQNVGSDTLFDFAIDAGLGQLAFMGRTLSIRLDAGAALLARAEQTGSAPLIALALHQAYDDIAADARLGRRLAILMRVALMAGDDIKARALFLAQRSRPRGEDLVADQNFLLSIPLSAALGIAPANLLTPDQLQDSIAVHGYAKTVLLLSALEGLTGNAAAQDQWDALDAVDTLETRSVNPVRWRRFLTAVGQDDQSTALRLLPRMVAGLKQNGTDPIFAGSFIAGLGALGMNDLAQGLMRETLLEAGF